MDDNTCLDVVGVDGVANVLEAGVPDRHRCDLVLSTCAVLTGVCLGVTFLLSLSLLRLFFTNMSSPGSPSSISFIISPFSLK